jgi:hypothetical protein
MNTVSLGRARERGDRIVAVMFPAAAREAIGQAAAQH